jgi:hypothetical protein
MDKSSIGVMPGGFEQSVMDVGSTRSGKSEKFFRNFSLT